MWVGGLFVVRRLMNPSMSWQAGARELGGANDLPGSRAGDGTQALCCTSRAAASHCGTKMSPDRMTPRFGGQVQVCDCICSMTFAGQFDF